MMNHDRDAGITLHASCVQLADTGILIRGPSGAGKSTLALALMAMGAGLVADDRTCLRRRGDRLIADAPAVLRGRIEARGVGIIKAEATGPARLGLVVDLGQRETLRLPPPHHVAILDIALPLVLGPLHPGLAPALRQLVIGGRSD